MSKQLEKVLAIAEAEVGYLEKKSNSQLDDKTANAGSNNYTKYARDLDNISGFYNGRKNGYPWCDVFVDWLFVQAFGVETAKQLLCQPNRSLGAGCGYSANYYKAKGQFYKNGPQPGDQIFFIDSVGDVGHTGIVYKVDVSKVYTIEGNTSGASGVVANGGGVCKKSYALNYNKIYGYGRPNYETDKPINEPQKDDGLLSKGDTGAKVKELQQNLIKLGYSCGSYGADGAFGNATQNAVKKFQADQKLSVDGVVGPQTFAAIEKALKENEQPKVEEYTLKAFIRDVQSACGASVDGIAGPETLSKTVTLSASTNRTHKVVKAVQKRLTALGYTQVGVADGITGPKFTAAVKAFQKNNGCYVDGIITARNLTWKKLLGMK